MKFLDKLIISSNFTIPAVKFDLQSHSSFSDGRNSPLELIKSASENSYQYMSITDHNTLEAYDEKLFVEAKRNNVILIPGVELECFGELDILVYDDQENNISTKYISEISSISNLINSKRDKYLQIGLKNIITFLDNSSDIPWINWKMKTTEQKNEVISSLNVENISRVNLENGQIGNLRRSYISKPHIAMLLAKFNLIDLTLFASTYGVELGKAPGYAIKVLFEKFIEWPLDSLSPQKEIVDKILALSFPKIIAHPGKTFERQLASGVDLTFQTYLTNLISQGFDGAEIDYRNYKSPKFDYNVETLKVLKNQTRKMFGTGGSDTHSLFS